MVIYDWLSLTVICFLGAMSPGPSLMVILTYTSSYGRGAGVSASIGHGLGVFVYAIFAATGLSFILNEYTKIFQFAQIFGALFLCWIGVKILFSKARVTSLYHRDVSTQIVTSTFRNGFLIAILNPKIAAFFLSLFSQFLVPGQSTLVHIFMAVLASFVDGFVYVSLVILASTSLIGNFLRLYQKKVEFIFGGLLIFFAISMLSVLYFNILTG